MKKSISMLLILSSLLTMLVACGEETADEQTSGTTVPGTNETQTETEAETEPLDPADILDLPDMNWDGREFMVLGQNGTLPQWINIEINVDEITGEPLNDAVFNRNRGLEAKYNVIIAQNLVDGNGTNAETLRTAAAAGESSYDAAFVQSDKIGGLAGENLLYDLNTVEHIDFSKNWWNPIANESLTIANKLFFTTSDLLIRDKSRLNILLYNKDMVKNNNLEAPMDLVYGNQWTLDKFFGMAEQVGSDLDGDGTVNEGDQFGFIGSSASVLTSFVTGCGSSLISKDEEDFPVLNAPEQVVAILDVIMPHWANNRTSTICEDWAGKVSFDYWDTSWFFFWRGNALFTATTPNSLGEFSANCEYDYGVLPFPKLNEEQEHYYTSGDGFTQLFCIPTIAKDTAFSGFMLEALSEASTDTSLEAFIEISCKGKYVYDEDSAKMLDLIFDTIVYDQATVFGISNVSSTLKGYGQSKTHNYASDYARMNKATGKTIEKLIEKIQATGIN